MRLVTKNFAALPLCGFALIVFSVLTSYAQDVPAAPCPDGFVCITRDAAVKMLQDQDQLKLSLIHI